jgi:peptide/nickel transport system ATP-binding protein
MSAKGQSVLRVEQLSLRRPSAGLALTLPSLQLDAGDSAVWLGPSGVGKTTALAALAGLLHAPEVELRGGRWFRGEPIPGSGTPPWRRWLRHDVAFVPQDAAAAFDPLVRLGPQMVELSGRDGAACVDALRRLDEPSPHDVLARHPHEVSGGQAQRVLLAVALARGPSLFLLDEPTASLDEGRRGRLVAVLRERLRAGAVVLAATHDAEFGAALDARAYTFSALGVVEAHPPAPAWPERPPEPSPAEVLLRAAGVVVRRRRRIVLDGVDLALHAGEVVALLGPSGVGKTTLAMVLAGLLRPTAGRIEGGGGARAAPAQLLFQHAYASLTPGRQLWALVAETARSPAAAAELARSLGLAQAELARPARALSGGQRRRAALLRALTVEPRVLILDEPTASLDPATASAVVASVLAIAAARRAACLLITHDAGLAHAVAHRVLVLEHGRLRPTMPLQEPA